MSVTCFKPFIADLAKNETTCSLTYRTVLCCIQQDNSAATQNGTSPSSPMLRRRPSDPIVLPSAHASSPRSTSLPEILPGTVSTRQPPTHAVSCRHPPRPTGSNPDSCLSPSSVDANITQPTILGFYLPWPSLP